VCNVEALLWTYEKTGKKWLLEMAEKAYVGYDRKQPDKDASMTMLLSNKRATEHGVTFCETSKLGAILYQYTGKKKYLEASVHGFKKVDRDQMLVDGVPSASELLRGKDWLDSTEMCDMIDYTWAIGYLFMATGNADYADKIERACFNAFPGAVEKDFRGLQYFSCPNQVIAAEGGNHNAFWRGNISMSYRLDPGTECCPGQVSRFMPNYASRTWMRGNKGEVVTTFYGPSRHTFTPPGSKAPVTIVQETRYPFSEEIDLRVECAKPTAFTLKLRIPGWCRGASVSVNDKPLRVRCRPGTFIPVRRTFANGDRVRLVLPMKLRLSKWDRGCGAVEYGPLVFSLPIGIRREVDRNDKRQTPDFPAWNMYPSTPWNYALALKGRSLADCTTVVHQPVKSHPWTVDSAPIAITVPVRRVRGWKTHRSRTVMADTVTHEGPITEKRYGNFELTTPPPEGKELRKRLAKQVETVTLVPYGCTYLRLTLFPLC
jgi:DUF1680 family protein